MTESYISFPRLGLNFNVDSVAFTVGSKDIYWYGIIIAFGFLAALITVLAVSKKYGVSSETIYDIVIFGTPSAIICARLYYVIFQWESYAQNPIDIFKIWNGGIAIYGGIIGAVAAAAIYCRVKKCNLPLVFDLCSIGLAIGQMFGRWGNFFNQEAFGTNTENILGMTGNEIKAELAEMAAEGLNVTPDLPVHPTFLYESFWSLCIVIILFAMLKHRKFDGQNFLTYAALYGFGRFFIEGLRTDSLYIGIFRISQLVAAVTFIAGIVAIACIIKSGKCRVTPCRKTDNVS